MPLEGHVFIFYTSPVQENIAYISSNGYLSFLPNEDYIDSGSVAIPNPRAPNNFIAPLWTDLDPYSGGDVFFKVSSTEFIAQWTNVPEWNIGGNNTFQVILSFEDLSIEFRYENVTAANPVIGIENENGRRGLSVPTSGIIDGSVSCVKIINTADLSSAPSSQPSVSSAPTSSPAPSIAPSLSLMPSLSSAPTEINAWEQGNTVPGAGGQVKMASQGGGQPLDVVCGAIEAVLAHPTMANICFAGGTNGGVWRTFSCTSPVPNWKPLTDNQDSNSVGDMVFDVDVSNNPIASTILVAVGTRSSFGQQGGPGIGMLLTDNALDVDPTWITLDNANGTYSFRDNNVKFNSVYIRGNLILASAYRSTPFKCPIVGIWRSADRGDTWTNVLQGVGRAIASDPNDPSRFYATLDFTNSCNVGTLPANGVFASTDSGLTWTPTTNQSAPLVEGELNNAKLSVSADGSRVWSSLLKDGRANSTGYSDDNGRTWTLLDDIKTLESDGDIEGLNPREKPGSQGSIHFALLASPNNKNLVYIAGDRQDFPFPNFIGATDFTGRLFRGNASTPANNSAIPSAQWDHLTDSNAISQIPGGGTASGSTPHADGRDMEIRADGAILESDDGGIAIRTKPMDNTGDWFSVCGNMQVFETHNVAYEPIRNTV